MDVRRLQAVTGRRAADCSGSGLARLSIVQHRRHPVRALLLSAVVSAICLIAASPASAAARVSVASGNWNSPDTWSDSIGGASGFSVPVAGDTVTIDGGFTVTVTADAACASVAFTRRTATSLTIAPEVTLTVSDALTIPRSVAGVNLVAVGAGTLKAGNVAFTNTGTAVRHHITITTGRLTVAGNVEAANHPSDHQNFIIEDMSASITLTGAGLLQVGGTLLLGGSTSDWPNVTTGTLTTSPGSTVEYNGADQTVHNIDYFGNLTLSGSGVKTLQPGTTTIGGNLTLSGAATMTTVADVTVRGNVSVGPVRSQPATIVEGGQSVRK
ncbi:MAG: hypothetical protein CL477_17245 [Acidobacteria bacterium]|nr:hypothetical protein [Acidobacteriota bacterium]